MYYITKDGIYYEGERASLDDIPVPKRPSPYHKYESNKWVVDEELILKEKINLLNIAEADYKNKLLLAISESQKNDLKNKYNILVNRIRNISTPKDLEEFKF